MHKVLTLKKCYKNAAVYETVFTTFDLLASKKNYKKKNIAVIPFL